MFTFLWKYISFYNFSCRLLLCLFFRATQVALMTLPNISLYSLLSVLLFCGFSHFRHIRIVMSSGHFSHLTFSFSRLYCCCFSFLFDCCFLVCCKALQSGCVYENEIEGKKSNLDKKNFSHIIFFIGESVKWAETSQLLPWNNKDQPKLSLLYKRCGK